MKGKKALTILLVAGLAASQLSITAFAEEKATITDTVNIGYDEKKSEDYISVKEGDFSHITVNDKEIIIDANIDTDNGMAIISSGSKKEVVLKGNATSNGDSVVTDVVTARTNSTVTIEGDVISYGKTSGVQADNNCTVTVNGDVITKDKEHTGVRVYDKSTVTVNNIKSEGTGFQVSDDGSKVIALGTVEAGETGIKYQSSVKGLDYEVVAYEIKVSDGGKLFSDESIADHVSYIVKDSDGSAEYRNLTVTGANTEKINGKDYYTARENVTITVTADSGYKFASSGKTYTITIPRGGAVTLEAIIKEIEKDQERQRQSSQSSQSVQSESHEEENVQIIIPDSAVTPITVAADGSQHLGAAVISKPASMFNANEAASLSSNGKWRKDWRGYWHFAKDGKTEEKNKWVFIADGNGNASWFYFDAAGHMLTGWNQIDGKWYFFNKEAGSLYGALLTSGVTPDGYTVDADGVYKK